MCKIQDIEGLLKDSYKLRRNAITRRIENCCKPLTEEDFNTIFIEVNKKFGNTKSETVKRLIYSSFTKTYNPIIEFFNKHKGRKPSGAIDDLFDTITSDNYEYSRYFGRKWLVSIIASVYGQHSPLMLVLSGKEQNTGKTEWLRRLLPNELHDPARPYPDYYAESKLDAGKDDEIMMTQKLIIMDDEMGGKSKKDEKRLKELLSKQTFSLREPYGHINVDLARLAVLCGTTNEEMILNDPTGNRRIIPITVYGINQKDYNGINKIDVMMEAFNLYHAGYDYNLNKADIERLNDATAKFNQYSLEYELITKYFCRGDYNDNPHASDGIKEEMTCTEMKNFLETSTLQKLDLIRMGRELSRLGYNQQIKYVNGSTKRLYNVIKLTQSIDIQSLFVKKVAHN